MKIVRILSLASVILIPNLAGAALPITSNALGRVEGIMDFCAKAIPQNAASFNESKKQSAQGASDIELIGARNTKEYKEGYTFVTNLLTLVPQEKAVDVCNTLNQQDK